MMSAFECYREYVALKNHFSKPSYDYFKYRGKTSASVAGFDKRNDRVFFQKLAKHEDVHNFLVANLSLNEKLWIRDLAYNQNADKVYKDWLKRQQSLSYMFKQELDKLDENFNNNFICKDNEHPLLLKKFLAGDIALETICLLLEFTGAKSYWDKQMKYDLVYDNFKTKLEKYTPFIKCDRDKLKKVVLDYFEQ